MLYTPLLPEAASGTLEPRHTVVPLRVMCPHANLILGRATSIDEETRRVHVAAAEHEFDVGYEQFVVTLGAGYLETSRSRLEHALGFKSLADAIHLRNHVLRELEAAAADPETAERHLTFVFVGAGYAGVEALGELSDLVRYALRYYPGAEMDPAALRARGRCAQDPARDPAAPGRVRDPCTGQARRRHPRLDHAGLPRRRAPPSPTGRASRRTPWSGRPA